MAATPVAVQYLPPAVPDPTLHYDLHAHTKLKPRMVSQESHLAFSDILSMHQYQKKLRCSKWIPAWSKNDAMLRAVIMHRGWKYCHGRGPTPAGVTMQDLKRRCDAKFNRLIQREYAQRDSKKWTAWEWHKVCVSHHGGYLAWMTTVLYMSFRLGWSSVEIARELGAPSAVMVRQIIYRANVAAEALGFSTHDIPHSSKGVFKHGKVLASTKSRRRILVMRRKQAFWPRKVRVRSEKELIRRKHARAAAWREKVRRIALDFGVTWIAARKLLKESYTIGPSKDSAGRSEDRPVLRSC